MDEGRARSVGVKEGLFREVNEMVREVGAGIDRPDDSLGFLCECGDANCVEEVSIRVSEYEGVRRDPTLFFVVPGHDAPDVEEVVEEKGTYNIVRKRPGLPEEIARDTHPR
jgi:hypothetical protein